MLATALIESKREKAFRPPRITAEIDYRSETQRKKADYKESSDADIDQKADHENSILNSEFYPDDSNNSYTKI
eukprot:COSAG01_NODE_4780_length_4749_cov_2.137849_1_plen_73_part_00